MNAMAKWKVELTAGGQTLTKVKIKRCIFLEDSLLPLLFIKAMIPLNYVLKKCMGLQIYEIR